MSHISEHFYKMNTAKNRKKDCDMTTLSSSVSILLITVALATVASPGASSWTPELCADLEQIRGPPPGCSHAEYDAWHKNLTSWRDAIRLDQNLSDALYHDPRLAFAREAYTVTQMSPYSRRFYSRQNHSYTVKRYVAEVSERFGGIDVALIWATYPQVGVDDRNQFDWYRSLPAKHGRGPGDGLSAFREAIQELLRVGGTRALMPLNPWDVPGQNTRPEPPSAASLPDAIATLIKNVSAVGFNGDTMITIPMEYVRAAEKVGVAPLMLQPEIYGSHVEKGNFTGFQHTSNGWAYFTTPNTLAYDLNCVGSARVVFPRHLSAVCSRWSKQRAPDVLTAFVNGIGLTIWSNVWQTTNGYTERDAELIWRWSRLSHFFGSPRSNSSSNSSSGAGGESLLQTDSWRPLVPCRVLSTTASVQHCNASSWDFLTSSSNNNNNNNTANRDSVVRKVYFISNFNGTHSIYGYALREYEPELQSGGIAWFDCYRGVQIKPRRRSPLYLEIPVAVGASDIGCIVAVNETTYKDDTAFERLLQTMRTRTAKPLSGFNSTWSPLQQTTVPLPEAHWMAEHHRQHLLPSSASSSQETANKTKTEFLQRHHPHRRAASAAPAAGEELLIPATSFSPWRCIVRGIEIEGPPTYPVDFQWSAHGERAPQRAHNFLVNFSRNFTMDRYPVTNGQWLKFIRDDTAYVPRATYNYLRFWSGNNNTSSGGVNPPPGAEDQPVTWISPNEAAAYCQRYGKRLPTAFELQFAGQSSDYRIYPWGNSSANEKQQPTPTTGANMPLPPDVSAFPDSASPFGVEALVGVVWHWTRDLFVDDENYMALIRGGSYYRPSGSGWYLRQAYELATHQKYPIMDESFDRAGTIGFRCVRDV